MNNDQLKKCLRRIEAGEPLPLDEQATICRDLLRANARILTAKRAGFHWSGRNPASKPAVDSFEDPNE